VGLILSQICLRKVQWLESEKFLEFVMYPQVSVIFFCFSDLLCSVVVLGESPCTRGASRTNFQVISVISGIPQGSVLGHILFIIYINDLVEYCGSNADIFLFADDAKIFFSH